MRTTPRIPTKDGKGGYEGLRRGVLVGALALLAAQGCASDAGDDAAGDEDAADDAGAGGDSGGLDVGPPDPCDACSDAQVCLGGRCLEPNACGCAWGEHCEESTGLCAPGCREDIHCGLGAVCSPEGACIPGCSDDLECAVGSVCREGVCARQCEINDQCAIREMCIEGTCSAVSCVSTVECPRGQRCAEGTCAVAGAIACDVDEACGKGWTCAEGTCVDCLVQEDCSFGRACVDQVCVPPATSPITFEVVSGGDLDAHSAGLIQDDILGYGPGAAISDFDLDGDVDIVVGQVTEADPAVCLYRNEETESGIRFVRDEAFCSLGIAGAGVAALPWEPGEPDAIVAMGRGTLTLLTPGDSWQPVDLFSTLGADDPRRTCQAGTGAPVDLDLDGDLDLLVACQEWGNEGQFGEGYRANLVFLRDGNQLVLSEDPVWEPLRDIGVTLAIGVLDFNADGLQDLIFANDSFSTEGRRNTEEAPGRVLFRCTLAEDCAWRAEAIVEGERAWGSFMGVAQLHVAGENYMYLTDWGPKLLLQTAVEPRVDAASQFGLDLGETNGFLLFSWSAVPADWDGDGNEDVFVTHGMVPDSDIRGHDSHVNFLMVQSTPGSFQTFREGFGVHLPSQRVPNHPAVPPSSRAALPADLDGDGRLDLLILHHLGFPEVVRHVAPAITSQCTVNMVPSVVPSYGFGLAIEDGPDGWRAPLVQGHLRSTVPSSIHTRTRSGRVRFASGAILPFACEDGSPFVTVVEPSWLTPGSQPGSFRIDVTVLENATIQSVDAVARTGNGVTTHTVLRDAAANEWRVQGLPDGATVQLRINGQWVNRLFPGEAP